ncbi:MAG: glycosyltransferase family 2 protein, partial [Planctomycetota bacterium]
DGSRSTPFFKPDWSPEYFLASMYTCHLTMYRRTLLASVGGFREGFDGSQDYDLMLRASEHARRIVHVPHVCYHWRKVPGSTAASEHAKSTADPTRRALHEHLERRGIPGTVEATEMPGVHRVRPSIQGTPRVSIVIPTRDRLSLLRRCVESIERLTTWGTWDVCIVDNGSAEPDTLEYLAATPHQVVRRDEPFNFSRLVNAGVAATAGEFVLLLNNDIEVITPGWLEAMLEMMQFPEVGVVGAKLYYPDERIQHAGVITGVGGVAGHAHRFAPRESYGYFGSLLCTRNFSAVTAACMLVRRSVYESVGGFDARLAVAFNDIDFCLRVRDAGHRVVWTPHAELYHYESASRGHAMDPAEIQLMQSLWGDRLRRDPYYHPALTLEREDYTLSF